MKFDHLPELTVDGSTSEEYGDWVSRTAKLLKRPYMGLHKLLERENWSTEEIKRAYLNATKHNGNMPSDIYWWWKRKVRNGDNSKK